jgi:hypothetical protein
MWYDYPKFQPGETGVFILQPDSRTLGAKAPVQGAEVPTFTIPRKSDVLPVSEADRVRTRPNHDHREAYLFSRQNQEPFH